MYIPPKLLDFQGLETTLAKIAIIKAVEYITGVTPIPLVNEISGSSYPPPP
jgi:hypothetical protein